MAPKNEADIRREEFRSAHPEWFYTPPPEQNFLARWFSGPYYRSIFYWKRINDNFGLRFLIYLASAYLGIKGFLYQLIGTSMNPYFVQFMGVDAQTYQVYSTVAMTPWSLKAFMGMVSDTMPTWGWAKRGYLMAFTCMGTACFFLLGLVNFTPSMGALVALLFFLGNFEASLVDILSEGRYAQLMMQNPQTSSDVVSWVWMVYYIGSLAATWIVGPLADQYEASQNTWYLKGIFLLAIPFAFQVMLPLWLNYLGEQRLPRSQWGFQRRKWRKHKKYFQLAILMGTLAMGMAVMNLLNNQLWRAKLNEKSKYLGQLPVLVYLVIASLSIIYCSFKVLPSIVAKSLTFLFITETSYVIISGATDIFYISGPECVPDGPNFSYQYFLTVSGTVQSICGVIGVALFQAIMSEWEFRPCFWVSVCLQSTAGMVDIIMVKRWNIKIGLSDKVTYMFGYNMVYQIVYMFNFMPSVVLISKLCPKGMESTIYALLAGFNNFGQNTSRSLGVYFINAFGVHMTADGPCDYDNLALMILVANVLMPLLISFPLTFVLVPKGKLTDNILSDDVLAQFEDDEEDLGSPTGSDAHVGVAYAVGGKSEIGPGDTLPHSTALEKLD